MEIGPVVKSVDLGHDPLDLIPGQDGRQAPFPPGLGDVEEMPLTLENIDEEEFDAGVTDAHGRWRPAGLILTMDEVVEEFILGQKVRTFAIMVDKLANSPGV